MNILWDSKSSAGHWAVLYCTWLSTLGHMGRFASTYQMAVKFPPPHPMLAKSASADFTHPSWDFTLWRTVLTERDHLLCQMCDCCFFFWKRACLDQPTSLCPQKLSITTWALYGAHQQGPETHHSSLSGGGSSWLLKVSCLCSFFLVVRLRKTRDWVPQFRGKAVNRVLSDKKQNVCLSQSVYRNGSRVSKEGTFCVRRTHIRIRIMYAIDRNAVAICLVLLREPLEILLCTLKCIMKWANHVEIINGMHHWIYEDLARKK